MGPLLDLSTMQFGEPLYLWLLVVPAGLLLLWIAHAGRRRRDVRRFRHGRSVPVRERFALIGGLLSWLCLLVALSLTILAAARPRALVALVRTNGVDLVVLQDGSASMYARDVKPDRWQRSVRFLRVVAESLQWRNDRIALALFAHIAAPQVRLTRDPNTFFFFLDHLNRRSPFPLADDTTWDTNIELGIYWGVRVIERDAEIHGPSANAQAFVLVSDGQAWSGEVEQSLQLAKTRKVPLYVVGVGTPSGAFIPEPDASELMASTTPRPGLAPRIYSTLDRASLWQIARAGGGQYFDLDRESDRIIASRIIEAARRSGPANAAEPSFDELYPACLAAAGWLVCLSALWWRQRGELWLQALGTAAMLGVVWLVLR